MAEMDVDQLNIKIEADSGKASDGIDLLIESLEMLQNAIGDLSGLKKISKELEKIGTVSVNLKGLDEVADKISKLTIGLKPLETMGKNTINPFLNSLKKLPDIAKQLQNTDLDKFAVEIERVTKAIRPLANEMNKVANGFNAFPQKIQKLVRNLDSVTTSSSKTTRSFSGLLSGFSGMSLKAGLLFAVMSRMATTMGEWVQESNNYVENLNLFTVAMGEGAEEALKYAETVNNAMGIDMSQFIRNQGVFNQMITGFGLVGESANKMSKNLTTLGYDISSFHNISINDAMLKLESGIAGELEPLRKLGYALDEVTLKELAFSQGIEKNIRDMSQAEKSQLRYIAIMKQSKNAMGDMARTLSSPANQMRILEQQILQLKRALGNVLIPIIMKVLPYVTALVRVLADGANALARLMGFELPKFDYDSSNITGGLGEIDNGLGDIKDSADKAKKAVQNLAGFDELNILSKPSDTDVDSTGGTGGGGGIGGDLGVELPEYDFLAGLDKQTDEIYKKMKDTFKKIGDEIKKLLPIIKTVATALAAIWAIKKIMDFVKWVGSAYAALKGLSIAKDLSKAFEAFWDTFHLSKMEGGVKTFKSLKDGAKAFRDSLSPLTKLLLTIGGAIGAFAITYNTFDDVARGTKTWGEALAITVPLVGGLALAIGFLVSPIGGVVTALAGIVGGFIGFNIEQQKIQDEFIKAEFFDNVGISIDTLTQHFIDSTSDISRMNEAILTLGTELVNIDSNILSAQDSIERYSSFMSNAGTLTEEQATKMKSSIDSLVENMKLKLNIETDIIYTAFSDAARLAAENLGVDIGSMMTILEDFNKKYGEKVEELGSKAKAYTDIAATSGLTPEQQKDFDDTVGNLSELTRVISENEVEMKTLAEKVAKIDFGKNPEYAKTELGKLGDAIKALQQENLDVEVKIKTVFENTNYRNETLLKQGSQSKAEYDSMKNATGQLQSVIMEGLKIDQERIDKQISTVLGAVSTSIKTGLDTAIDETIANNKATGTQKFEAGVIQFLGIDKKDTALRTLISGEVYESVGNPLLSALDDIVKEVGVKPDTDAGRTFLASFDTLGKEGANSFSSSMSKVDYSQMQNALNSKEFNSVISSAGKTGGSLYAKEFSKELNGINFNGKPVYGYDIGTPTRPKQYATGGFPTRGDMFIANEQGPEMVGTIGGRTAVANNDQIVSAIEAGVYRAVNSAMGGKQQQSGDIVIPVYIGNDAVDEIIVSAQQRQLIRSNGRG